MAGTQVPRDPNMSVEVRRFLDDLSRRQETANIFYNLNATQATALLNVFTDALKGLVPASGGGTTNFLRADQTWAPLSNVVRQVLQTTYTANANITLQIPSDDTTPLIGEGTEILSQAITPADATNKVLVEVAIWGSTSTSSGDVIVSVFRGSTCIQAVQSRCTTADFPMSIAVPAVLDSPASASAQTYSVRVGPVGAITVRLNGNTATRIFGGAAKCTLTLTEIEAS